MLVAASAASVEEPHVANLLRRSEHNVTYRIMAYRKLARAEMLEQVRASPAQPRMRRRKTPLRNKEIEILTSIGAFGH